MPATSKSSMSNLSGVSTAKKLRGLLSKVMQSSIKGLSVSQYKAKPLIDLYMVRNRLSFKFTAGQADSKGGIKMKNKVMGN